MDRINHIDNFSIDSKTLYLSTIICHYLSCLENIIVETFENHGDESQVKRVKDLFVIKEKLVTLIKQTE